MRLFNFHIHPDLDSRLKAESERSGAPMSEIARRAIRDYLERADYIERERRRQEVLSRGETGSR